MFQNIELTQNHRQAGDWEYAEMLNRIRMGEHTEEDLKVLASKISKESPPDALYVFGKNAECKKLNDAYLEEVDSPLQCFKVSHPKGGNKKPCPETGRVQGTSFMDELRLKIGARVIIINNVDVSDHLSNGSCGDVVGFEWSGGKNKEINKILVQFEDPRAGAKERARHPKHPAYPDATPICREVHEYSLGKNRDTGHISRSKLIQYPLDLAWALTCHKVQGAGLKPPKMLVADFDSIFDTYNKETKKKDLPAPGMAYVMLGRVQNINQLILRWCYDPIPKEDPESERKRLENNEEAVKKISVNKDAKKEALRLKETALNNPKNMKSNNWLCKDTGLKIVSLNVQGSLQSRIEDLRQDNSIMAGDIICLQETGTSATRPELEGYTFFNAGAGKNKGVAIYMRDEVYLNEPPKRVENEFVQGLKLSCGEFDLITIYLANHQSASTLKE